MATVTLSSAPKTPSAKTAVSGPQPGLPAARAAPDVQQPFVFEDSRGLLHRDDPDPQRAREIGQRTDQRSGLPGEDHVAELRRGLLH